VTAEPKGEAIRESGIPSFCAGIGLQGDRAGEPDEVKAPRKKSADRSSLKKVPRKWFKPAIGSGFVVGVVGQLQFEVLASRIELDICLPVRLSTHSSPSATPG